MFYIPFWIYAAAAAMMAAVAIRLRGLRFIDIQIMLMVIAAAMSMDMLFCKTLGLYTYVSEEYQGWYSFWANLLICPLLGLTFIKFAPSGLLKVAFYIVFWVLVFTLFELFIAKPFGILLYPKWRIFPWSTIGYVVVLTWEYIYFKILKKRIR